MNKWTFVPNLVTLNKFNGFAAIEDLSNEVSVYAASPKFVLKNCGPIAKRILNSIPNEYYERIAKAGLLPNIDVRVHRLNKGEFPAVPGWHCDGARRETYFGQPDLERTPCADHIIATVSSLENGVSNTQFLTEPVTVTIPGNPHKDFVLWKEVHKQIKKSVKTKTMLDGEIVAFDTNTLHRAMPAHERGWRLFFRMSGWHNNYLGEEGKISTQQQVYVVSEGSGW